MTKKVAVFTGTRAEYGLLFWLLKDIQEDSELKLQLLVSGMHFSPEIGQTYTQIEKDGFHIDEKIEIWQSNTISRYIAKLTNNIPNNEEMVAYADSIFESAHDLFFPLNPTINVWVGEMHLKNKKNLLDEILPKAFTNFEKLLSKYEGNFFLGERAFYCDFNVYHHVSLALLLDDKILDNFSKLKKFMSDFEKIQGILDYLESRPKLIGIGTWPNGDRYEGDWVNGQRTGQGKYFYSSGGGVYTGEWKNRDRKNFSKIF